MGRGSGQGVSTRWAVLKSRHAQCTAHRWDAITPSRHRRDMLYVRITSNTTPKHTTTHLTSPPHHTTLQLTTLHHTKIHHTTPRPRVRANRLILATPALSLPSTPSSYLPPATITQTIG